MAETSEFLDLVQERPRKRLCSDPSPANGESNCNADLLLKDETVFRHLKAVMGIMIEEKCFLKGILMRNREMTESRISKKRKSRVKKLSLVTNYQSTVSPLKVMPPQISQIISPQMKPLPILAYLLKKGGEVLLL